MIQKPYKAFVSISDSLKTYRDLPKSDTNNFQVSIRTSCVLKFWFIEYKETYPFILNQIGFLYTNSSVMVLGS